MSTIPGRPQDGPDRPAKIALFHHPLWVPQGVVSLWVPSSGEGKLFCRFVLVRRRGAEHRVQDVDAATCKADEGGVVFLAFSPFAVVVGPAERVGQGGERGQEERAFQLLVAAFGWVFSADAGARAARDWR